MLLTCQLWERTVDSLGVHRWLDLKLHDAAPDHSTLSRTPRLMDVETHQAVFTWILQRLAAAQLVAGPDDRQSLAGRLRATRSADAVVCIGGGVDSVHLPTEDGWQG